MRRMNFYSLFIANGFADERLVILQDKISRISDSPMHTAAP